MSPSDKDQDIFQLLVETAGCMIVILRGDNTIAYFNSFAERLTGHSARDVVGRDYSELFLPAGECRAEKAFEDAIHAERATAVRCRDGSKRWLEWQTQQLDDYDGDPGLLVIGHDVTDWKQATEDLRNQEARLRAVLDTAVDGIITIDERGTIQSVNNAAEIVFGYPPEEMIGRNISMLMPQPYRSEHDGYLANYVRTGEKKIIGIGREVEARRKDGTTFPCDIAVSEVPLAGQRLFTGFVRDATERKKAQEALAERETFLQTIFDTEPECVQILGPGGTLMRINGAGLRMIEADSFDQVEGQCLYSMVVPRHRAAFVSLADNVFAGESGTLEFDIVGLKGTRRRLDTHAVPLRNSHGDITALLGITRDVTEQKRAEDRALQAERLAAIGETVTGLAHESRNAFQRSQACLEMLALELEDRPTELELVDRAQRALDHLHKLYEEVRDYAAPIKLDRQACDVGHLWRDAWSLLEVSRCENHVELREHGEASDLSCNVDWFAMGQVFRNIFENAIAACREPGLVEVRWRECDVDGKRHLEVAIRDNGPGIAEEDRQQVFNAFFTTKTKGTGLGMAIARRIVEAHAGRITIGNSDGGAEFIVSLPRE